MLLYPFKRNKLGRKAEDEASNQKVKGKGEEGKGEEGTGEESEREEGKGERKQEKGDRNMVLGVADR